MNKVKYLFLFFLTTSITEKVTAQHHYTITNTFRIAGAGGWDYVSVYGNRLYVSHGTQVNIMNKLTGDSLGIIPGTIGVHGIAFDETTGNGYTSNGRLNNVFVFNSDNGNVLDSIATGINPDAVFYERYSKTIITCNGRSNDLTLIDPEHKNVIATIAVNGKPETAVGDGNGKLFVNLEDKNAIAVVDLISKKLTATWPLYGAEGPTGLCYDAAQKRLLVGCEETLVVVDAVSGKLIDKIGIGAGCDGVAFDATSNTIFTANGQDGTMSVIQQDKLWKYFVAETLHTAKSGRTITIDQLTHTVYIPCADLQPAVKGERPKIIPGTFKVLVVQ